MPAGAKPNAKLRANRRLRRLSSAAYAFIFSQQGLMAGLSIEGTKISRIER